MENYISEMIWICLMCPPFLTSMLIFWKGITIITSLRNSFFKSSISHYMALILPTSAPETQESTNLDRLSEPTIKNGFSDLTKVQVVEIDTEMISRVTVRERLSKRAVMK